MKFSLARAALTLAATATLAACGAGGKATFPVNVTVSNLVYPGMVMSTNGMDQKVDPLPKSKASANIASRRMALRKPSLRPGISKL